MKTFIIVLLLVLSLAMPALSATVKIDKDRCGVGPTLPHNAYLMPDNTAVFSMVSVIGTSDYANLSSLISIMEIVGSKRLVMILNSPGGSLFDGMAIASLMEELVEKGIEVEVRGYGVIASAASFILVSGTPGKRFLNKNSMVMIHELSTFEFLSYKSVGQKEKELGVLKFIQGNVNQYLAKKTGMKLDTLKKLIVEETWFTPEQAVQYGFADKVF